MTDTIHGFPIIEQHRTPSGNGTRAGRVILVQRPDAYEPWITAWQGRDGAVWDGSWCWGHYFADESEARDDYSARASRGY